MTGEARPNTHTYDAGLIVAAWHSAYATRLDAEALRLEYGRPMLFAHPACDKSPTANMLWDVTVLMASGVAAQIMLGKFHPPTHRDDLMAALAFAERVSSHSPFLTQPWTDASRPGKKFDLSATYAVPPPAGVASVLDIAYRKARNLAEERREEIVSLAGLLAGNPYPQWEDVQGVLGTRPFAAGDTSP